MTDEKPLRRRDARGADGVVRVRDVVLGTARPEDFSATDTAPVADLDGPALLELTEASEPATRRRATLALAERDADDNVRDRLETLARTDPDADVRQFAVEALAKVGGDPQVARDLLDSDDDQWVRAEAAVALDRLDREGNEAVFETLLDDEAPMVRRNALISLTRLRPGGTREELLAALDDPNDRVREWAAKLLGAHDDDPGVEMALRRVVDSADEVDVVRETAARSLGARGEDVESIVETKAGTEMAGDHVLNRMPDG